MLLVGPPGTGKTLLARAIAGEANVPFFTISGSDFVEMFVGVGASRVRDMFEQAKKHAPCIVFIDEIDAVGRHRGAGLGGGNDEREQTLNQLLVEMDGFEANEGVILIAATNRPDVLDPALLRPGRFDRQVVVPNPDVLGRERILQVHMKKVRVGPDVDPRVIARGTPGFSGADLANIVNEAALLAARSGKRMVSMVDFEAAKDKVMMGAERRSMVMTEDEKRLTAYHEAGHAIVGCNSPASDPIHKATIIPRGRALGMVMRLPEGDRISVSREKLNADIAVAMGGRVAEELIFGHDEGDRRRRLRHRAGHQDRAPHGHPLGHERRARAHVVWREPAGGLPRPLDHPDQARVRGDRADDRLRDPQDRRRGLLDGLVDHLQRSRQAARPRQRAARARDPDGRGDRRGAARRADAEGARARRTCRRARRRRAASAARCRPPRRPRTTPAAWSRARSPAPDRRASDSRIAGTRSAPRHSGAPAPRQSLRVRSSVFLRRQLDDDPGARRQPAVSQARSVGGARPEP